MNLGASFKHGKKALVFVANCYTRNSMISFYIGVTDYFFTVGTVYFIGFRISKQ